MSSHPSGGPASFAGVTGLLHRASEGDGQATNELFPLVYDELRRLAGQHLIQERAGHTLQPTALVHEAYMRLVGPSEVTWESRAHFFGAAARAIRRILIDSARAKATLKREGGASGSRIPLDGVESDKPGMGVDLLALDEALERLAALDAQKAKVVELRFFGGLTGDEVARSLGVSPSTVARDWEFARVWLRRELSRGETA
jgi:RNA polymerase sigma factor (TIGR02999 family)